jgi:hypothetical protein
LLDDMDIEAWLLEDLLFLNLSFMFWCWSVEIIYFHLDLIAFNVMLDL